jgi:hypothetical protein
LGPDLSFFKKLKQRQAERTQDQMEVWGSGKQREIAEQLAHEFKKEVRWATSVFLPADSFQVMCNGPSFAMLDDLGGIAVIQQFEACYGIHIPNSFWIGREQATFGEIVEALTGLLPRGSI